jgi:hypothetical protein
VVESPVGYHVIQVTGEQQKEVVAFDVVKDRLQIMLKSQAQQKVAADYIEELKNKATIKLDGPLAAAAEAAKAAAAAEAPADAPVTPVTAPAAEVPAPAPAP